jgi:hypothetical protein
LTTTSARAGVRNLRSGRKKACGAVEQKKAAKQGRKKSGKKALAFVAAITWFVDSLESDNALQGRMGQQS